MSAKLTIYTKLGAARVDAFDYVYTGTHMGERKVTVEVKSATAITFEVGDYIIFGEYDTQVENERMELFTLPVVNRVYNSMMLTYSLTFWSRSYELKTVNFLDYIEGTENQTAYNRNTGEVDVDATIVQLLDRIVANMARAGKTWTYTLGASVDDTVRKQISVQNVKCWDALDLVQSLFGLEYIIEFDRREIKVGYNIVPLTASATFEFGKGKGLCEITRLHSDQMLVTRLYAYGATTNIPPDYRTTQYEHGYMPRLMLPADDYPDGYIWDEELEAIYGIREDYFFDETIYPKLPDDGVNNVIDEVMPIYDAPLPDTTITPTPVKPIYIESTVDWYYDEFGEREYIPSAGYHDDVTEIKYSLPTSFTNGNGMNYNEVTVFIVTDIDINAENVKSPNPAKMAFTSGNINGTELQINSWTREYIDGAPTGRMKVVLQRYTNDDNYQIPNANLPIAAGDKFVLLNIYLPNAYVTAAETQLETAALANMSARAVAPLAYSISIPEEYVKRDTTGIRTYLREGCALPMIDTVIGVDATYLIQSITVTHKAENILPTYDLTIADKPIKSRFQELEANLKSAILGIGSQAMQSSQVALNQTKSLNTLKSAIVNNYGELRGSILEPQSVLPSALGTDLKTSRYILQAYLQLNYEGDVNSAHGTTGVLIHKDTDIIWGDTFDIAHQTWTIGTPADFTLDPAKYYWVYIKGSLDDGTATWYLSETKIQMDDIEGYYMFEWGQINPVVGGYRYGQNQHGINGIDSYVYIAYGSSLAGDDFTLVNDPDLEYMAILSTSSMIPSPAVGDFVGLWFKRKGDAFEGDIPTTMSVTLSFEKKVQLVNDRDLPDSKMLYGANFEGEKNWIRIQEFIGTSVNQTSHGFGGGEYVYNNAGTWELADATSPVKAAIGAVIPVYTFQIIGGVGQWLPDPDVFAVLPSGFMPQATYYWPLTTANSYSDGVNYYLSTTPGEAVDEETALAYPEGTLLQYLGTGASCYEYVNLPVDPRGQQGVTPGIILNIDKGTVIGTEPEDGITPHIGENGNWYIGETDTGIPATGPAGADGYTPVKGVDYFDGINGTNGQDGADGYTPYIQGGNWWINGVDTGVKAEGVDGTNGTDGTDGRGIVSVTKTSTLGLVDTYTITYTDSTTSTFDVTNGADGSDATVSIGAGAGMDFTTITDTGDVVMGTPSTVDSTTVNEVTETSHTHELGTIDISSISKAGGYGALYNWWAATDARNITSDNNWIVPQLSDVITLMDAIDVASIEDYEWPLAGGKLKVTGTIYWDSPNTGANNEINFNGKGVGYRQSGDGLFSDIRAYLNILTTTVYSEEYGMYWGFAMYYDTESINLQNNNKTEGFAIRFVRPATTAEQLLADGTACDPYTGNDGKEYPTVKIGTQVWLAANLNETKYRNGDWITGFDGGVYTPISNSAWAALTTEAMCYYSDNEANGGGETPLSSVLDDLQQQIDDIPAQIQADWNQADTDALDYIKNKPTIPTDTDEKVKYDANDTTAGYLSDKIVAGTGITVAEGTGADENKLKISATPDTAIKVAIDFVDADELEFVYNCPVALVFTSQESEGADATISPALNTNMSQYGKVTITASEVGLIVLNGNTL